MPEDPRILADDCDPPGARGDERVRTVHDDVSEADLSRIEGEPAGQELGQGGLASSVVPHDRHDLSRFDVEADVPSARLDPAGDGDPGGLGFVGGEGPFAVFSGLLDGGGRVGGTVAVPVGVVVPARATRRPFRQGDHARRGEDEHHADG